jgi:hypothetical protein
MKVNTTATFCDRCLQIVSPVLVMDNCDLAADYMYNAHDPKVKICKQCLADMLDFVELNHESALTIDPLTGAVILD